jgi:hypothetical protein
MRVWLKALGIFALMVATPFVFQALLGRYPFLKDESPASDFPWANLLIFGGIVLFVLAAIIGSTFFYYRTDDIAAQLNVAERELNSLLRAWGGGMSKDARKDLAKERAGWLTMIKDPKSAKFDEFFDLSQKDVDGGPQGKPMGKARITAFLLRELYEGNVETAQAKIFAETKNNEDKIPFVAPGIRELVDFNAFDVKTGFPPGSGVNPNLLWLTAKTHRYPRNIIMVKADKSVVRNRDVLEELTAPKA